MKPRPHRALNACFLLAVAANTACSDRSQADSEPSIDGGVPVAPTVTDPAPPAPDPVEVPLGDLNCAPLTPVPNEGRLLTRLQYRLTVADLFDGLLPADTSSFPPENEIMRFQTNAVYHRATPLLAEAHMLTAEQIAAAVVADLSTELDCSAGPPDEACGLAYIEELAPRVYRRPLSAAEASSFEELFLEQLPVLGWGKAVALVIEALLQSPQFLYRFEFSGAPLADAAGFELTSYEAASRLSYFLWNSMPDAQLFEAAANDELRTAAQLEAQAHRMLEDPKARQTVDDFYTQWLGLGRLGSLMRDAAGAPAHDLAASWKASLDRYLLHTFWQEGADFNALMTSKTVFVDKVLADLYGVPAPDQGFIAAQLADNERAGLLTQPALLALLSHSDQSSPILRGVFVREEVLCQPPPAPPPNVDQTVPDPDPNATTRERFAVHTSDPACAACHSLIDPIGLGFEQYDHLGRYRETENDLLVDASGGVVGVREKAIEGEFNGAVELAERLATSEQAKLCLVTQWYRYAAGRVEQDEDLCSIAQARKSFGNDGNMAELLVGLALSDAFRFRAEPTAPPGDTSQ